MTPTRTIHEFEEISSALADVYYDLGSPLELSLRDRVVGGLLYSPWWSRIRAQLQRVDELEAALDRIRALHREDDDGLLASGRWCPSCGQPRPCATTRALAGPGADSGT